MPAQSIAIIAGSGNLPIELALNATSLGIKIYLSRIDGLSDEILPELNGSSHGLGEFGARMKALKAAKIETILFAGYIKRPNFKSLKFDAKGLLMAPKIISAAKKGDDAIMRAILQEFENEGFKIIGPETLQSELLAPIGPLGAVVPNSAQIEDINFAAKIAAQIGKFDIGQGCVVCNGLVLAVEAQEGTDAMLKRINTLEFTIRGTVENPNGILCKRPKPIQELRIDLPTIGTATVENVIAAGLSGIAVEAGGALIAQRKEVIEMADAHNIFIYGFDSKLGAD